MFPTRLHILSNARKSTICQATKRTFREETYPNLKRCARHSTRKNFISTTSRVIFEVEIGLTNRRDEVQIAIVRSRWSFPATWQPWPSDLPTLDAGLARARDGFACEWKVVCVGMKTETSSGYRCSFVFITVVPCVCSTHIYNTYRVVSRDEIEACLYGASTYIIDVNHCATRQFDPCCMQITNDIVGRLINKRDTERTSVVQIDVFSFLSFFEPFARTSAVVLYLASSQTRTKR